MEARKDPEMESMKNERPVDGESEGEHIIIRDTYKIAYVIHFLLGAGNLLPWNTLITAIDYFGYLYPDKHVEKVFSVAYMISSVMVVVMMLTWENLSRKLNFRFRMNLGFSMFVLSLVVTPIIDWSQHGSSGGGGGGGLGYYLSVASVVICGLADGLIGGTLVGSAGKLPKQYMQAIFAGTASSGVLVCILRISTKASLPHTTRGLKISAHMYFAVCVVVLLGCIVCCNLLYKLSIMGDHYKIAVVHHHQESNNTDQPFSRTNKFWEVARLIQCPAFGVFTIYTVTLSIFPGFLAENIESKYLKDWYPILLITIYNVSDFLGKTLTAICVVDGAGKATWGSVARILFYPMFSACLHGPKWLKTEMPMAFLTALLGLSNGYLTSCVMILAPKLVLSSEAETAAVVMVVFLGLGLVAGSLLGWFWLI